MIVKPMPIKFCMHSSVFRNEYGNQLTEYEQNELASYEMIYTIGLQRIYDPKFQKDKVGFYKL